MSLISIDWTTVLITTLSTLVVGLIIARYGYKIWKEQFHYQKKVEL